MKRSTVAIFGSILYFACLIAGFGFLSLAFDLVFIAEPVWGPYRGAFMIAGSVLIFLLWQLSRKEMHILTRALVTGASIFLVMPVASGVWFLFSTGSFMAMTQGIGRFALSPFVLLAAIIGFLVSIITDYWALYERRKQ